VIGDDRAQPVACVVQRSDDRELRIAGKRAYEFAKSFRRQHHIVVGHGEHISAQPNGTAGGEFALTGDEISDDRHTIERRD
jgi:hypothetical protein